ncbi:MAG: response regulator, partial [Nitrospirota bacterium]
IVKQHDGHINVYSEKGKGTTFKIYLPLIDKGYPDIDKTEHIYNEALQGSETILVAEDSPEVMEIIVNILTENGYRVIKAMNGIDAIEKFRENKDDIHLFLSDIVMPNINGIEAFNKIRKIKPDIKALFISGYPDTIIRNHGMTEQNFKVISKPFKPNELLIMVKNVLMSI